MADIRMAVGETLPVFNAVLQNDGEPVDLTSATVTFDLTKYGRGYINDAAVTVIDAPTGQVRYSWATDDLTETGTFTGTFKATYPGPTIEYFDFVIDVTDGEGIQPAPTPPVPTTYVLSVNGRTGHVTGVLDAAANLTDLDDVPTARDNLGLGDSATRDVGTTAGTVAAGDDSRFTDPPTGAAGGVLSGTYPNPGFASDMATQAESDAAVATRQRLHGFPDRTSSAMTFIPGTRSFIITATGASFTFHINGVLYTKVSDALTVSAVDGPHYIYYNSSGVLTHSTSPWNILTDVPVALVIWSTTAGTGFMCEERHTDVMDTATHDYLHATRGTQLKARPALSGYTLSPATPADADNTMAISSDCVLADEDIYTSLAAVSDGGGGDGYSVLWRTGATEWTWTTALTVPFVSTAAGYINANTLSGTWSQVQLANNQYVNYWLLAVPAVSADARYQFLFIPGQTIHTSLANAQAESVGASLVLTGLPFTEFAFTHRLTFRTSNTYSNTGKCRLEGVTVVVESVANITAATATAAASVTNVPSGNIAATNVQAALNELDSEKIAKAGDTFTGTLAGTLAATTTDALTTQVSGDTNTRFVIDADGTLRWGPGNAGLDASSNLYRVGSNNIGTSGVFTAGTRFTGGEFRLTAATAGTDVVLANVTGDSSFRFDIMADGTMEWGPGNASRDTNLYRSAANVLKTDDAFVIAGASLSIGTTPASTGAIRLPNNQYIYARNAGNTADIALARLGTTDIALYGEGASSIRFAATTEFRSTSATLLYLLQVTNDQAAAAGVGAGITLRGTSGTNQMANIGSAWDGAANTDANLTFQVRSGGSPTTALTIASTLAATFAGTVTLTDAKDLIVGSTTGTKIATATTQKLAFHNATPVIQRAGAAQAAVSTTAATNSTPYGFTTAAQADAIVTLVNELRAALVEKGIIKGSA